MIARGREREGLTSIHLRSAFALSPRHKRSDAMVVLRSARGVSGALQPPMLL